MSVIPDAEKEGAHQHQEFKLFENKERFANIQ